ncbi:MAG TPA: nucleotide sugar dehydrogenase [Candidatus Marinimicrobia bacterium]|nr:nucleotide sugar dehydrogenase [Candidatus Neomarinimicrobiota bacterium]
MDLKKKIENRSANIGVIGLGYVGLPLAMEFVRAGFKVTGIDVNTEKVDMINAGNNYIQDVSDNALASAVSDGNLNATTDFAATKKLDSVSICVPTPLKKHKNPDISYIVSAMNEVEKYIHPGMIIILESTTYPGSTRELILPSLETNGFTVGKDFFLCFSPERIDPGNTEYTTQNTPKVIGGITDQCTDMGAAVYGTIVEKVVTVSSPETAEMVKLLENTFRAINIGLANEVAIMCEKLGVDVWEVINAAGTKPFGFMKFSPGPGLGGHCIPIDPHYLSWKLKTLDYDARFIQLAGEINTAMPRHVLKLVTEGLNQQQKALKGSKVLIIGVAYKKDVNDVRESPALDILQLLEESGVKTDYFDPHVESINWDGSTINSIKILDRDAVSDFDACIIVTDHSNIDFELIRKHCSLIIDTRNVYHEKTGKNIIRLGVGNHQID